MPAYMATDAAMFGAINGLVPIGWIVLNIIFLHRLTTENGSFKVLQDSIAGITDDRRLLLLHQLHLNNKNKDRKSVV